MSVLVFGHTLDKPHKSSAEVAIQREFQSIQDEIAVHNVDIPCVERPSVGFLRTLLWPEDRTVNLAQSRNDTVSLVSPVCLNSSINPSTDSDGCRRRRPDDAAVYVLERLVHARVPVLDQ